MKINIDDCPDTAERYQVASIPTLALFHRGELVDRVVGAVGRGKLEELLAKVG